MFLQSKGLSSDSSTSQFKSINSSALSFLYSPTLTSYMITGKTIALIRWTFVGKVMSLLFNMLSAAAAKSLQPCLTLCNPIDDSPQAPLFLGFSRQECWSGLPFPFPMCACMLSRFTHVRLWVTPWTAAHQTPLSTEFSRQEYWSFSFSISPSKEHPGLIFRMDWMYLHPVQGTLKSLLQHYSSRVSILRHSAFFIVQLSHHTWLLEKP